MGAYTAQLELAARQQLLNCKYFTPLDLRDPSLQPSTFLPVSAASYLLRCKHQLSCLSPCFLPRIEVIDAMAEPIGLASGLLALAGFAFQATVTLLKTVQSYQIHPKNVRDLKEELEALGAVLSSLTETVNAITEVDLSALNYPLLRCGSACEDFGKEIMKCSSRTGDSRTSFRDWAKLRYMGDNIDGFRQLLAGYKSTIIIALTDANL
jgi:hypothetical protein